MTRDGMTSGIPFAAPHSRFAGVSAIAILRGGGLGDVLFALPALAALRAGYPGAHITLLGTQLHAELLPGRTPVVDAVEVLPQIPGVGDGTPGQGTGEGPAEDPAAEEFLTRLRGRFDLGVQVHGGGRNSNPFLLRLGPRHTVGTQTPDAAGLERTLAYAYYQHEILRALEVAALAGCPPVTLEPRIEPTAADLEAGAELLAGLDGPVLAIHPGASDPRRRWPAEHFAEIATRFVAGGGSVVVLGGQDDAEAAGRIAGGRANRARVRLAAGELSIGELTGVLARAHVFCGNDSGPRHLAQAVGTPTASVFWFGNLINAGPFERGRHRVQLSWTTNCPVCGRDATQVGWTAERCEHDDSFVAGVAAGAVWEDLQVLMATTVPARGR